MEAAAGASARHESSARQSTDNCVVELVGRFRGLPWSELQARHLQCNRSSAKPEETAALHAATISSDLGDVDAFIRRAVAAPVHWMGVISLFTRPLTLHLSHSWSDDGEVKYTALSHWAADFQQRRGREPVVWLDKAGRTSATARLLLGYSSAHLVPIGETWSR